MLNRYMDETLMAQRLETEGHRAIVGGLWDVIGPLQVEHLIKQGLKTTDQVLDVGCGSLRGGVPMVRHLDPGGYYGIDISTQLLQAGYDNEIAHTELEPKLPRDHLFATSDFHIPFDVAFDFGLAVSVFTHLPLNYYTRCLSAIAPHFRSGGTFHATTFEGAGVRARPSGITTYDDRDPYHFTRGDLIRATPGEWHFDWIGEWGHPRDQQMIRLTRA